MLHFKTLLSLSIIFLWISVSGEVNMNAKFFEKNHGQNDLLRKGPLKGASFFARGNEMSLYLMPEGIKYIFHNKEGDKDFFIDADFINGNMENVEPLLAGPNVNYYSGNQHIKGFMYKKIYLKDVWDKIDIELIITGSELKINYLLNPGADPDNIQIKYSGSDPKINNSGELVASTPIGKIVESKPFSYYNGKDGEIASSYLLNENTVGFELEKYDNSKKVIIDPIIKYSTYFGGSGDDVAYRTSTQSNDDVLLLGYTTNGSYPAYGTADTNYYFVNSGGQKDIFLASFSSDNSTLDWVTFIGGTLDDVAYDMDITPDDTIFIAGQTYSKNLPMKNHSWRASAQTNPNPNPTAEGFAMKLDPDGNIIWGTYLGGGNTEKGTSIKYEPSSKTLFTGGNTNSTPFQLITGNAFQGTNAGGTDMYIVQLDYRYGNLLYGSYCGGTSDDQLNDIESDYNSQFSKGYFYFAGATKSASIYGTTNPYNSGWDVFTMQMTGLANYSVGFHGGTGNDIATGIYTAPSYQCYVVGFTTGTFTDPGGITPAPTQNSTSYNNGEDGFLLFLSKNTITLNEMDYIGSPSNERATDVVMRQKTGDLFISGYGYNQTSLDFSNSYPCDTNVAGFMAVYGDTTNGPYYYDGYFINCDQKILGIDTTNNICEGVYVAGKIRTSSLDEYSSAYQSSNAGGTNDAFLLYFNHRISYPEFASNVLCRSSATAVSGKTFDYEVDITSSTKGGHFYGKGSYYSFSDNKYKFHADSSRGGTHSITHRIYYKRYECALEESKSVDVVYASASVDYPVQCAPNVSSTTLTANYHNSYSPDFCWTRTGGSSCGASTTSSFNVSLPLNGSYSETYELKVTYNIDANTGCYYDGMSNTIDTQTSRISYGINRNAVYYWETGMNGVTISNSGWTQYHSNFNWYRGTIASGTSLSHTNSSYQFNGYSGTPPEKYYLTMGNICNSRIKARGYAEFSNDVRCRVPNGHHSATNYEVVYDPGDGSWGKLFIKNASNHFPYSSNVEYYLNGKIEFLPGSELTLSNAYLTMGPNAEIIVYPGAKIDLIATKISTCTDPNSSWKGAIVYGPSNEHYPGKFHIKGGTTDSSIFRNSLGGIIGKEGANIRAEKTIFKWNKVHVEAQGEGTYGKKLRIVNCTFKPTKTTLSGTSPYYPASFYGSNKAYIYGHNLENSLIKNNRFRGKWGDSGFVAIQLIQNGTGSNSNNTISQNSFENRHFDHAIYLTNADNLTVDFNEICSLATSTSECDIKAGIFFKQTSSSLDGSLIDNNYFQWLDFGVEFYSTNPSTTSNTVLSENTFYRNEYGLNIASHDRDVSSGTCGSCSTNNTNPSNPFNLEINCNDFHRNEVGIAGNGDIIDQGSSSGVYENGFGYGTTNKNNLYWDIIWGTGSVTFYEHNQTINNSLNFGNYCISCNANNSPSISPTFIELCNPERLKKSTFLIKKEKEIKLTAYPNPFHDKLNVKVDFNTPVNLMILDLNGKILFNKINFLPGTHSIPTSYFGKGLYIIKANSQDGKTQTLKIIKF